jgi:pyruvate dehydrogenase E2 component (dihydrolipoamide acetyltransferase)
MATVLRMPALAAGATEAAIQAWLVGVGDTVAAGQAVVEIETEKAVVEHEVDEAGVLAAILVDAGAAAAVGAPIAVLADDGESVDDAIAAAGVGGVEEPAQVPAEASAPAAADQPVARAEPAVQVASAPAPAARLEPEPPQSGSTQRLFASPLVRRLARERGIDLQTLRGSGPQGRIVRRDLDDATPSAPAPSEATVPTPAPAPGSATAAGHTDVPHTRMRAAIARRLTESVTTVPHFFLVADCRVDELLALRERINATTDVRVSVNDFVLKAVAVAMREVPDVNAIWLDDVTRRFDGVDVGVAVSIPGGLVSPVVRGVDRLGVAEIGARVRDLADRAKAGKLSQDELEGGSFAVSNLGMYGTKEFSAIINPPHSGILAVGAATRRPVVDESGELAVGSVMTVTLSADHRVIDGALAAQWLAAFTTAIEHPLRLLV